VAALQALIATCGLDDRITLTGELDAGGLDAAYDRADLLVAPSLHETFGMAAAEAVARGLPVVSSSVGAIAAIAGDGALLVPPGDADALKAALARAIGDPVLRAKLAAGSRVAREKLGSWEAALDRMCAVLTALPPDGRFAL
jgi:glycosyltransferase involved in cell wall biosynthesis